MIHFAQKSSHQHLHFHFTSTPQLVHASDQNMGQSINERKKTKKEKVKESLQLIHTHFSAFVRKYIPTNRDVLNIIFSHTEEDKNTFFWCKMTGYINDSSVCLWN